MKTLYLVRHAKSSWDNTELSDFERPLNKRGKHDAPFMSKILKERKVEPGLILSSPAIRAVKTAEIFAEELHYPIKKIETDMRIYESTSKTLFEVVREINDSYNSVFLFGHNPGLSNIANIISDTFVGTMSTCSIVGLELKVNSWKEIEKHSGKLILNEFPKKYF